MSRLKEGFFHYRLPPEAAAPWGVAVHGGGAFAARAGEPYPPVGHPSDHTFEWETGRALGAFQVVLIAQGRGEFESRATGRVELVAGNALVLLPACRVMLDRQQAIRVAQSVNRQCHVALLAGAHMQREPLAPLMISVFTFHWLPPPFPPPSG